MNFKIINEINKRLPDEQKPVNYLMDQLCIGKEAAYRRLRNQIPFTLKEVVHIANHLDFSIDRAMGNDTDKNIFFSVSSDADVDNSNVFYNYLLNSHLLMNELVNAQNINIEVVLHRIPIHFFPLKNLFKFDYCRYLYSNGKIPLLTRFSDIEIPQQLSELHKKNVFFFNQLPSFTCIVGDATYTKLFKEIHYYHQLKFLSDEDLQSLQSELFDLIKIYETMLRTGENDRGSQYTFYYSVINLDANVIFCEMNDKNVLMIPVVPENPLMIVDNKLAGKIFKKWYHSQIRNSILISKTDNIIHMERLVNLYRQIEDITKPC